MLYHAERMPLSQLMGEGTSNLCIWFIVTVPSNVSIAGVNNFPQGHAGAASRRQKGETEVCGERFNAAEVCSPWLLFRDGAEARD